MVKEGKTGRVGDGGRGAESFLPLRPEILFMLLVLGRAAKHGYGLIEAVESESRGEVRIQTGSLYRFLAQLLDDGLIEEVAAPAAEDSGDERRRYYAATALGRSVGQSEVTRLRRIVDAAEWATSGGSGG